jgi:hypothetical protein
MPQQKYGMRNLPLNGKNQIPNVIVDLIWFVAPPLSQPNSKHGGITPK